MNHQQTIDHELRLFNQYKSEGKKLVHFCNDWDGLAIHSEMDEIAACCCDFLLEDDKILRNDRASEVETRRMRDTIGPARLIGSVAYEDRLTDKNITRINININAELHGYPKIPPSDFLSVGAPAHSGTLVEPTTTKKLAVSIENLRSAYEAAKLADVDMVEAMWFNLSMDCSDASD